MNYLEVIRFKNLYGYDLINWTESDIFDSSKVSHILTIFVNSITGQEISYTYQYKFNSNLVFLLD